MKSKLKMKNRKTEIKTEQNRNVFNQRRARAPNNTNTCGSILRQFLEIYQKCTIVNKIDGALPPSGLCTQQGDEHIQCEFCQYGTLHFENRKKINDQILNVLESLNSQFEISIVYWAANVE